MINIISILRIVSPEHKHKVDFRLKMTLLNVLDHENLATEFFYSKPEIA